MEFTERLYLFTILHRKWLINAALVIVLSVAWMVGKAVSSPKADAARRLEEAYAAWRANPDEHFEEFQRALVPFPIRKRLLQGEIAEWHLISRRLQDARREVSEPLAVLRSAAPQHADFAEIAFLIAQKDYQQALEQAVTLKEAIRDKKSILFGQNLLRIALLQQEVGNQAGEWAAWKELEDFKRINAKALAGVFPKGPAELADFETYIEERKKHL